VTVYIYGQTPRSRCGAVNIYCHGLSRGPDRSTGLRDQLYFQQRAEQEIRRAELAEHPDAARAHYLLAGFYLDLVHNGPEPPACQPRGARRI
jgi:hypothetical protein